MVTIPEGTIRRILEWGAELYTAGVGADDDGQGLIDEIPMDTEAYIYVTTLIHYIKSIAGVLAQALEDETEI